VFAATYYPGWVDVYYDGILLSPSLYTATSGTAVVLSNAAIGGDPVTVVAWQIAGVNPTGPTGQGATGATGPTGPRAVGSFQEYNFVATQGQTVFVCAYTAPYVEVYVNGIKLVPGEFQASNGTEVILNAPSLTGDTVDIMAWNISSVSQITGPTGPTGVAVGYFVSNIAVRDTVPVTLGTIVYVYDDGSGHNQAYIAAAVNPTTWIGIGLNSNGQNIGNSTAGSSTLNNRFLATGNYGSASPVMVGTMAPVKQINYLDVSITTAFNDPTATIDVGTDSVHGLLMDNTLINTATLGSYTRQLSVPVTVTTAIKAFVGVGTSTQGAFRISMDYS
jgi:hypothetical protein